MRFFRRIRSDAASRELGAALSDGAVACFISHLMGHPSWRLPRTQNPRQRGPQRPAKQRMERGPKFVGPKRRILCLSGSIYLVSPLSGLRVYINHIAISSLACQARLIRGYRQTDSALQVQGTKQPIHATTRHSSAPDAG